MPRSIWKTLRELQKLMPEVNLVLDDATAAVRELEKALADTDAAVEASVPGLAYTRYPAAARIQPGLTRLFRIVARDEGKEMPWLEAPRQLKLETFHMIPMLINAIEVRAAALIEAARAAMPEIRELLAEVL